MATQTYTGREEWHADNQYVATADVTILLGNIGGKVGVFQKMDDDSLPGSAPNIGHPLRRNENFSMKLLTGESLCMAGKVTFVLTDFTS